MTPRISWAQASRYALVFGLGLFALVAQTVLFRDFLTVYEGTEIGIGCFFGSWLIWLSIGGWIVRRDRAWIHALTRHADLVALLQIPAFALQQYLILHSRAMAGIEAYDLFDLARMFPVSMLVNAPISLLTGAVFALACAWAASEQHLPVARVYVAECLGSFAGGVAATLALAAGISGEQAIIGAALVLSLAVFLVRVGTRIQWMALIPALGLAALMFTGLADLWERKADLDSWKRLLPAESYRGAFVTPQAKYLYGEYRGQFNVVSWESVSESIPNAEHAAEVTALTFAQTPKARDVLIIGSDGISLGQQMLRMPNVATVTWIHPDPAYPRRLMAALPERFKAGLKFLQIEEQDARAFLQTSQRRFDLVIVNLPDVTTLILNRYFTLEFFQSVQRSLDDAGAVAVRLSGGENFMGADLVNMGASIWDTVSRVFKRVVLKPGEDSWLVASDGADLTEAPDVLGSRWSSVDGAHAVYPPAAMAMLYVPDRIAFQKQKYGSAIQRSPPDSLLNTDARPQSALHSLLLIARKSGAPIGLSDFINRLTLRGAWICAAGILLYAALRLSYRRRTSASGPAAPHMTDNLFLIGSTGFMGMSLSILLMFLYQLRFGSLFLHIGLISSLYMMGLFLGGLACERLLSAARGERTALLPIILLAHAAFLVSILFTPANATAALFIALFLACGAFSGIYVPIAAERFHRAGIGERASGAGIEMLDNAGGALGGLLTGVLLLPVLGGHQLLFALGLLLAANLLAIRRAAATSASPAPSHAPESLIRAAGFVLFGAVAFIWLDARILRAVDVSGGATPQAVQDMAGQRELLRRTADMRGRSITYWEIPGDGTRGRNYVFQTRDFAPQVSGFAGPIWMAVMVDEQGALADARIVEWRETPSYVTPIPEWIESLKGRPIFREDGFRGVDGVSGATVTSRAVIRTLEAAGQGFANALEGRGAGAGTSWLAEPWHPDRNAYLLLAAVALAFALRRRPHRTVRRIALVAVLAVFGLACNVQYSIEQTLTALSMGHMPPLSLALPFLLLFGIPLLVAVAGNIYCGYLCPFGAAQELLGELRPAAFARLDPGAGWPWARFVKYALLAGFVLALALDPARAWSNGDPLVRFFSGDVRSAAFRLGALALALSVVYPRFWCRTLCPAGAFLSLVGGIRLLRRFLPVVMPRRCPYGVNHADELDCMSCDRCRMADATDAGEMKPAENARYRNIIHGAVVLIMAVVLALITLRESGVPGDSQTPMAMETPAGPSMRNVDLRRVRRMIERGDLSGHEADFYRPTADP